jgi:hypothetical protein
MKTLEQYLTDAADTTTTVHVLTMKSRATVTDPDGKVTTAPVRFYIHPANVNGETLDFEVQGNTLTQDPSISYAEPEAVPAPSPEAE